MTSGVSKPSPGDETGGGAAAGKPRPEIETDESKTIVAYANFCRVMGTPEELIVDFGLNPQPTGTTSQPIPISERIVMNYYTAKRLLAALHMAVQRHEATFGVLETDVQKRVVPRR